MTDREQESLIRTSKTLLERLRENWEAWGSPADRDKCVNETCMAMDCKEAADEIDRLALRSSKDRVCRGCAHEIPWDWVFCAWCGFENDAPERSAPETNDCHCPHCVYHFGKRMDAQMWTCDRPHCGRKSHESSKECHWCHHPRPAQKANDIQTRPLYRCPDESCPGNHLSPGSVCKPSNGGASQ